jgi:D-alanyl-D-alanine dipeptidase
MKYFKIEEFTKTDTGSPNLPGAQEKKNIEALIENVLDPARAEMGAPITVTSGYRSVAANIKIGGAKNSQHTRGEAADLKCADNKKLFDILKKQGRFDQLIWEFGNDRQPAHVHVSYSKTPRKQILKAIKTNGITKYIPLS